MFQESTNLFKTHVYELINRRRDQNGWLVEIGIREHKTTRVSKYYIIDTTGNLLLFEDAETAWSFYKR